MGRDRIIVEESPMGVFMRDLPNTLLNLYSLNQQIARDAYEKNEQREWQAGQNLLTREHQAQQNQLSIAAEEYRSLRDRKYKLEDELKGYKLPYEQTATGMDMVSTTRDGINQGIEDTSSQIQQLMGSLQVISEGADFAKGKADQYGALIKASEDEEWRDKLLEGDITEDKDGNLVGSGEMVEFLNQLKTENPTAYEQLKKANYRKSFLSKLRTAEEAIALQVSEEQLVTADLQQEAAETAINANNFALFQAKNEEFEKNWGEIVKHQALNFTAQFRYGAYSMMDLVALGAEDPDKLIEIKEEFAELYPNINHEANKFLSGIQQAQANGLDGSKFVVDFYAKAYQDYLDLDEFKVELEEAGKLVSLSYKQMYDNLPLKDATRMEIDRLTAKVNGYKDLGMYEAGIDQMNHMYAISKMHDKQQGMRLTANVKEHEQVAGYGLELGEVETYYPEQYQHMSAPKRLELEKSLAFISATRNPGAREVVATDTGGFDVVPSKSELDVFGDLPETKDKDYFYGPIDYMGDQLFGEKFERAFGIPPDSLRTTHKDPNAPASLASQLGASLDELQKLNPDDGRDYLMRVFVKSNYLKSTGIAFNDIFRQWEADGRPDPGDWLLEKFSDEDNPTKGIEEELIR